MKSIQNTPFRIRPKTVYLAGPMTGIKNHNYPRFFRGEARLKKYGYKVINPARLNKAGENWVSCLRNDLHHIVTKCDTIALLKGWQFSEGARLELAVAIRLKFKIIDAQTLRPVKITLNKIFTHWRRNGRHQRYYE